MFATVRHIAQEVSEFYDMVSVVNRIAQDVESGRQPRAADLEVLGIQSPVDVN